MLRSRVGRGLAAALCAVVVLAVAGLVAAAPLGTAFTYQGQLRQAGVPVNGTCDLQFSLFDAASGGAQVGATQAASGVTLVDGRFTVQLDFGACPTCFNGSPRFLEIAVKPTSGSTFTTRSIRGCCATSVILLGLISPVASSGARLKGHLAGRPVEPLMPYQQWM